MVTLWTHFDTKHMTSITVLANQFVNKMIMNLHHSWLFIFSGLDIENKDGFWLGNLFGRCGPDHVLALAAIEYFSVVTWKLDKCEKENRKGGNLARSLHYGPEEGEGEI